MGGRMLRRIGFIGLVIVLAWLMGGVVQAEVYYVPDDYLTIQEAIDAAQDGDEIIVRAGTYYENIYFNGKAVYLHSEAGPDVTVIDGMGLGSVVAFDMGEGEGSIIEGFTITNSGSDGILCDGSSPTIRGNIITGNGGYYGGGISCVNSSSPTIEGNVITGNNAYRHGGGVYCKDSSPVMVNNTISDNTASWTGGGICCENSTLVIQDSVIMNNDKEGIYYSGGELRVERCEIAYNTGLGILIDSASSAEIRDSVIRNNRGGISGGSGSNLVIDNCEIKDNTNNAIGSKGGGINAEGNLTLRNSVVSGNNAYERGGGIYLWWGNYTVTITNSEISRNTSNGLGGGIYSHSGVNLTIMNSKIWGNIAGAAGGIYLGGGTNTIRNSEISGNIANSGNGGGVYLYSGSLTMTNCVISGNYTTYSPYDAGGGIYCSTDYHLTMTNCIVSWNSSGQGGGIFASSSGAHLTMTNCIVSWNSSNWGGGIFVDSNADTAFTVTNCIISWNSSGQGGGIFVGGSNPNADITYSDFYGNSPDDIYGGYLGIGCAFCDPQFVDADAGDYRLMPDSPCRDSGRPYILDPDGTRSDMGMYGGPDAGWTAFSVPFGTGWNLVAVSGRSVYGDMVEGVFDDLVQGGNVMKYNVFAYQIGAGYLVYPDDFTNIEKGRGYWLNAQIGGEYVMRVFESSEPEERVALSQGWNLIGNPYSGDVGLAGLYVEHPTEGRVGFEEAVANGWVLMPMFGYDPQEYYFTVDLEGGDYDYLMAWHGYWVLATVDGLELVIPKPGE